MEIKYNKIPFSTRVSVDVYSILDQFLKETQIPLREFIEIAIVSSIEKTEHKDLMTFEGIDIKKWCTIKRKRLVRNMMGEFRNETMSANTFMSRVENDLFALLIRKTPLIQIKLLIKHRIKEAGTYEHPELILPALEKLLLLEEKDYTSTIAILQEKLLTTDNRNNVKKNTIKVLHDGTKTRL